MVYILHNLLLNPVIFFDAAMTTPDSPGRQTEYSQSAPSEKTPTSELNFPPLTEKTQVEGNGTENNMKHFDGFAVSFESHTERREGAFLLPNYWQDRSAQRRPNGWTQLKQKKSSAIK